MASLQNRTTILLILSALLCLNSAFQSSPIVSSFRETSLKYPTWTPIARLSQTATVSLQNQRNSNDNDSTTERKYTSSVEDGSPLGVAIVVLGGLLVNFGGDQFADIPVWVILATASTAAGVARLIRYLQKKKEE